MSSYTSSPRNIQDYEFDNDDLNPDSDSDFEDDYDLDGIASDEDTEDASETEEKAQSGNRTEIKEQCVEVRTLSGRMYQDKLMQLKKQVQALEQKTQPDYLKKAKKIQQQYQDRLRANEAWRDIELERAKKEHEKEITDSEKDFKEKKGELKEMLRNEWNEKRMNIESERLSMDLTNGVDLFDVKPIMTRKLRRRPNDPLPLPAEKRRKTTPDILSRNSLLSDKDINEDLDVLLKVSGRPLCKKPQPSLVPVIESNLEVRIDDNKLFYEKRWFTKGQSVVVDSKETGRIFGQILAIGTSEIWVRRHNEAGKLKIFLSQLQKGKYTLQRRT